MGQSRVDTKQKHNKENSKDEQHGSHQKTRGEHWCSRRVSNYF
jgi:hypothetical protein